MLQEREGGYIMMTLQARNEYLATLRSRYWEADKKGKSDILDEYLKNTEQNRKYVIRKLRAGTPVRPRPRKGRQVFYDPAVVAALAKVWEILDYPCGQRLEPLLAEQVDRLRHFGELHISEETAEKLKQMSSATIDRKLVHEKEYLHRRRTVATKPGSLLKAKIPLRLTEWDTSQIGYIETDLVAHCGDSVLGDYINTTGTTEIASGWWEGEAILGKSQRFTFEGLKQIRKRTPFRWLGLDSDNDGVFINNILWRYCQEEGIEFTRSRPVSENDNAYIEQKNWTHIRKPLGYLRYDVQEELEIINDLYRNELRLYKNFFQPVMKLIRKERIGAKVKRKYDRPRTPYQRLMESDQIPQETKDRLKAIYLTLNPAELKRNIEEKLAKLYRVHQAKGNQKSKSKPKTQPLMVTPFMIEQSKVGLPF